MKRRAFVAVSTAAASTAAASLLAAPVLSTTKTSQPPAPKSVYEWRTYELRFGSPASNLETYLKDALIPALNRMGVANVGVFREMGKSDPAKIHVLIPYASWDAYGTMATRLSSDSAFAQTTQTYQNLPPDKAPYARYTTSLMSAFDALPKVAVPAKEPRLFELRTYEGYSEDAVRRKIKMFNVDEIPVFYRTKLNPVFFGEVVAGEHMPCLTYMLTFKNMDERDANWKQFSADADWKRISAAPEYANTVSNIIRIFLEPVAYSQI